MSSQKVIAELIANLPYILKNDSLIISNQYSKYSENAVRIILYAPIVDNCDEDINY